MQSLNIQSLDIQSLDIQSLDIQSLDAKLIYLVCLFLVIWDGWLRQTGHLGRSVPKILRFLFDSELKEPVSETGSDPCYGKCFNLLFN